MNKNPGSFETLILHILFHNNNRKGKLNVEFNVSTDVLLTSGTWR